MERNNQDYLLFEEVTENLVVTFRKSIFTDEYLEKLRLNERQLKATKYLKEHGKIDRKTYCNICGVKKTIAHKDLSYMVKKEIIKMVEKGRGSYYILRM